MSPILIYDVCCAYPIAAKLPETIEDVKKKKSQFDIDYDLKE